MLKTFTTFYKFFAKKRFLFVLFILFLIFTFTISNITPYFFKLFVDAISNSQGELLIKVLLLYIVVRYTSLILNNIGHQFGDYLLKDTAVELRTRVFRHIQNLDFAFHSTKSTGSLISAIKRGDGAFFSIYHNLHFRALRTFVTFGVMLFFFTRLNLSIALAMAVSFVLSFFVAKLVVGKNISARKKFVKEEDNVSRVIVDNLINYDTVKVFAKEEWELKRLAKRFVNWKDAFWSYIISFRLFDMGVGSLVVISTFVVLYLATQQALLGKIGVGDFVLIVGYVQIFFNQVSDLMWSFRDMGKDYADVDRYFRLLENKIKIQDPSDPVTLDKVDGEIEFDEVSFSYEEGQDNAVRNLSLKIRQGQSIALVGRSGSGKTTLTKLLMRFYDVSRGVITVDGVNIKNFTKSHLRSFMGVVPQEPVMFNNTIGYNIGYGKPEAKQKEIEAAAKLANLHNFIQTLPKSYKTGVGERGIKLSGGQKQRLAIARMILSDPEIIIFDEATSQLDSENEKLIQDAFWKVAKNKTTIIIAHRLSTAKRADKIIVMQSGKIMESGSHNTLLRKQNSLYSHFWSLQTSID